MKSFLVSLLLLFFSGCMTESRDGYRFSHPLRSLRLSSFLPESTSSDPTACQTEIETAKITAYKTTVYPIVMNRCAGCHGASQSPLFAVSDLASSFQAAQSRMNEANPATSRLAIQSANGHCGINNCKGSSAEMESAITSYFNDSKGKVQEITSKCGDQGEVIPGVNLKDLGSSKRAQVAIADRMYVSNVLIDIFGPSVKTTVQNLITSKLSVFGGPCDLYENAMTPINGTRKWLFASQENRCYNQYQNTQNALIKPSNTVRAGWKINACEKIMTMADARKYAIEKLYRQIGQTIDGASPPVPANASVLSAFQMFYPEQNLNQATQASLLNVSSGVADTNHNKWKWILLSLCISSGWEVP